jgi:hypothetical protein
MDGCGKGETSPYLGVGTKVGARETTTTTTPFGQRQEPMSSSGAENSEPASQLGRPPEGKESLPAHQQHCRNVAAAAAVKGSPCLLPLSQSDRADQRHASCQTLTSKRTNIHRLDTFLMLGGRAVQGLAYLCMLHYCTAWGGHVAWTGVYRGGKCVQKSYETRDVLGPACVPACLPACFDGWVGWRTRDRLFVPCAWQLDGGCHCMCAASCQSGWDDFFSFAL